MKKLAVGAVMSVAFLAGCSGLPGAGSPTATVTATVTATPKAAAKTAPKPAPTVASVKTSGNYGADLAAAGIVPDSVAGYGDFMAKSLCDSPLSEAELFNFTDEVQFLGKPGGESDGYGPAAVRLTVAYYCPQRRTLADIALRDHGYLK